jgi:hypothetical protein
MNRLFNNIHVTAFLKDASLKRGAIFGSILTFALLAFELFNFGTTSFALRDVLGDLTFLGLRWSTLLAFAFCGIDFAGIARIFTPEQGRDEPAEVWYLFGAWLLAAGFNASLTWWGVSVAIMKHNAEGSALVGQSAMTSIVPIMVAAMVWLIRVLIIGTFSVAGERLFTLADARPQPGYYQRQQDYRREPARPAAVNQPLNTNLPTPSYPRPAPKPQPAPPPVYSRPEPTYHPVGMTAMSRNQTNSSATRR